MKDYLSEKYNKLLFYDIAVHENTGWFCNRLYSVLFRIDLQAGEISVETILPTEGKNDIEQYGPIAYYDNQLIIAPRNSKSILIYNLKLKEIRKIRFDLTGFDDENRYNLFTNIHIVNNMAYIVPGRYHAVIKLNLDTFQIAYLDSWYKKVMENPIDKGKVFCVHSVIEDLTVLKMADWQNSQIIDLNLEDGSSQIYKVRDYGGISSINLQLGIKLVAYKNNTIITNLDTMEEVVLDVSNMDYGAGIRAIVTFKNMVYVFPINGNMVISIDWDTGRQKEFLKLTKVPMEEMQEAAFVNCNFLCVKKVNDTMVVASSLYESKIYLFDLEKENVRLFSSVLPEELEKVVEQKIVDYCFNDFEFENGVDKLKDWITVIRKNSLIKYTREKLQNFGERIYQI